MIAYVYFLFIFQSRLWFCEAEPARRSQQKNFGWKGTVIIGQTHKKPPAFSQFSVIIFI